MNETMTRLYQAARELKNIDGQSELARYLNVSPQVLKNWETRGISSKGLIQAAKALEIDVDGWKRALVKCTRAPLKPMPTCAAAALLVKQRPPARGRLCLRPFS